MMANSFTFRAYAEGAGGGFGSGWATASGDTPDAAKRNFVQAFGPYRPGAKGIPELGIPGTLCLDSERFKLLAALKSLKSLRRHIAAGYGTKPSRLMLAQLAEHDMLAACRLHASDF